METCRHLEKLRRSCRCWHKAQHKSRGGAILPRAPDRHSGWKPCWAGVRVPWGGSPSLLTGLHTLRWQQQIENHAWLMTLLSGRDGGLFSPCVTS